MSVSGSRAAVEINLDEFERRLRAAGAQPAGQNDPLYELARLVELSKRPMGAAAPLRGSAQQPEPVEAILLRPAFDEGHDDPGEAAVEAAPDEGPEVEDFHGDEFRAVEPYRERRSARLMLTASALAVAGVAMIGAVVYLKGGVPGLAKQPPYIAAAQGPTKVLPPSDDTVAAPNEARANFLKDKTQPAHVKVVANEEQPVDLTTLASSKAPAEAARAPADAPAVKAMVDTPVVATPAPPPPVASQFPEPKPVRTVHLRPDGTPIPLTLVASADATGTAPAIEAAKAKPAAASPAGAAANAQASTPKLELPTKLSGKSSARVMVGKTDTTVPGSIEEAANEPLPPSAKAEKAAKVSKTQVASADPAAPSTAAQQAPDSTAATKPTSWAVQLAAPKSEAEAKTDIERLNAKYASALNGSAIGLQKAVVNGDTVYRLRVVGLSKADAAALCARLKGDGGNCFLAK